jgi:acyl carrier protein
LRIVGSASITTGSRPPTIFLQLLMPDDDLRDLIKTMMVENLMLKVPKESIGDDLPLFGPDGLGLDSIDALELVVSLEKKFGVSVPNSETARQALTSVKTIHDYVLAHRKA